MGKLKKNHGFSLTEVLLSVGILSVGMIFIAGVFPVGIHYTTVATERTKAAIVADEAFAKIKLYQDRIDFDALDDGELRDFNDVLEGTIEFDSKEYAYPSVYSDESEKYYYWSALCRLKEPYDPNTDPNPVVQVTVFVSRKVSANLTYFEPSAGSGRVDWPRPIKIDVSDVAGKDNELMVDYSDRTFVSDGCAIVDDETGRIYRVLERYASDDKKVLLNGDWDDSAGRPDAVWVVPPPIAAGTTPAWKICSGRDPCIAVYQKEIQF